MKRSRIMTWCVVFMLPLLCGADTATLLEDRLRELVPDNPGAYIELAEVVADDINSDADRRLSIRLFAIAVTLDPVRWSRSGMLGILELLEDEEQIRRLQSMVAMQDGGRGGMLPRRRVALGSQSKAQIAAFDVLSSIRSGDNNSGRALLRNVRGTRELLESYDDEMPGGMRRLLARLQTAEDGQRYALSESDCVAQLQVQSDILGGARDTWSATLSAWNGRPLEDVSQADLGQVLELELGKTIWRDGWTEPE